MRQAFITLTQIVHLYSLYFFSILEASLFRNNLPSLILRAREEQLAFSELLALSKEDKITAFVSLLHLDNQQKIWLEQEGHLSEIWILLKKMYEEKNKEMLARLRAEVDALEASHEAEAEVIASEGEKIETIYDDIEEVGGFSGGFVEKELEDD